jgi:chemotaxis protein CheX
MTVDMNVPVLPSAEELGELVEQVWRSYLDDELAVEFAPPAEPAGRRMLAWVSITGDWTGHVEVLATPQGAERIAATMFQTPVADLSPAEIADAFGEIANMVGGGVKGMVGTHTALSLPQIVLDAAALVSPVAEPYITVHATWHGEPLEISLWEREARKATANEMGAER